MTQRVAVLVVDDEEEFCRWLSKDFERRGYACATALDSKAALGVLSAGRVDVMLLDIALRSESGLELLKKARRDHPGVQVIMLTGNGTVRTAIEAMKQGACDYLAKPVDLAELCQAVERAGGEARMRRENDLLRREIERRDRFQEFVGRHPSVEEVRRLARKAAAADSPVLVCGETGTGKELVARMIHAESPRRHGRFLAINCAALQESLLESELFGHEKGSFTDAGRFKPGLVELADDGTLFLDEIGSMSPATQAKILRLLDSGEYRRVGGVDDLRNSSRVVSATNQDLAAAISVGRFREDLLYRVNVVTIRVPPLRERLDDVPLLAEHFLDKFHALGTRGRKAMSPQAMEALMRYPWPGNVRELENVVERAVIMAEGPRIEPSLLCLPGASSCAAVPFETATLAEVEKAHVLAVLARAGGNRAKAASMLAISVRTLYNRLREYGLD
ncbi:MAG: sigma-54-dependent Fis family transcriptional regulator [Elusimicrobia bacterium]|nr:sigma-54-dependent Fis family transcriptional regulator [Elusimicrobiota bacterium]